MRTRPFHRIPPPPSSSSQSDVNKNVDWLGNPWFGLAYILLLLILRGVAYLMTPPNKEEWGWTALNVAHAVVRTPPPPPPPSPVALPRAGRQRPTRPRCRGPAPFTAPPRSPFARCPFTRCTGSGARPCGRIRVNTLTARCGNKLTTGWPSRTRKSFSCWFPFSCASPRTLQFCLFLNELPPPAHAPSAPPPARSFIISVYSTSTNVHALAVNFAIVVVLLIPKLPQLEGVRLFGINKGPSDDE